jgi:hypothetical protein
MLTSCPLTLVVGELENVKQALEQAPFNANLTPKIPTLTGKQPKLPLSPPGFLANPMSHGLLAPL